MNNELRIGSFTSSEIGALMSEGKAKGSFGAPALTYIEEKNMERRLGRKLKNETDAKPLDWGHLCEGFVFDMLGIEYSTQSKQTIVHPEINYWVGSPDSICYGQYNTVVDIKSPFTLKSFCQLVDGWKSNGIQGIRDNHKDGEKFYWQIVSNAILTGCKEGELIIFCPYASQVSSLVQRGSDTFDWLIYAGMENLPWIPDGNEYYSNINKFRFPIPEADKIALHKRVVEAGQMLVQPKLVTV
jgi:hypothetical protein